MAKKVQFDSKTKKSEGKNIASKEKPVVIQELVIKAAPSTRVYSQKGKTK